MNKLIHFLIFFSLLFFPSIEKSESKLNKNSFLNFKKVNLHSSNYKFSQKSAVKILLINGIHGSGTYIKIKNNFFILTAKHVIEGQQVVTVVGEEDEKVIGKIQYISTNFDIAVIAVPKMRTRKHAEVHPSNSRNFLIGEEIIYTGFPSIYRFLTSTGRISSYFNRSVIIIQGFGWNGSSGAGVMDSKNRLRAVVFAIGNEKKNKTTIYKLMNLTWAQMITEAEFNLIKKSIIKN